MTPPSVVPSQSSSNVLLTWESKHQPSSRLDTQGVPKVPDTFVFAISSKFLEEEIKGGCQIEKGIWENVRALLKEKNVFAKLIFFFTLDLLFFTLDYFFSRWKLQREKK
jgi:hypothetical protein